VAVLLLAAPLVAAGLDGTLRTFFRSDAWRLILFPAIIVYILAVAPGLARMDRAVAASFRAILQITEDETDRLVQTVGKPHLEGELGAMLVGAALGGLTVWATDWGLPSGWLMVCSAAEAVLMFTMLAWVVYVSVAGSRLMTVVHRQPLHVDPLDATPFEAIGRQALLLALVFVGGLTLSILFMGIRSGNFHQFAFWLSYLPPALVPVVIFFLIMQPTHRVLSAAKARELNKVERQIAASCRELTARIGGQEDTLALSQQILALSTYEKRLAQARTWPYNTSMLRTLFFSVLVRPGRSGRACSERSSSPSRAGGAVERWRRASRKSVRGPSPRYSPGIRLSAGDLRLTPVYRWDGRTGWFMRAARRKARVGRRQCGFIEGCAGDGAEPKGPQRACALRDQAAGSYRLRVVGAFRGNVHLP
jgi:hypothetical protein